MKRILSLGAGLLLASYAALHAQSYTLTVSQEPYTNLEEPTIITTDLANKVYSVTAPFQFSPYGVTFDLLRTNGLLITTEGYIAGKTSANGYLISAMMATMGWRDSTTRIGVRLEGAQGKQVLKIEWRNVKLVGNEGDDSMNVQLWLHEKSGDFEIHVGPRAVSGPIAYGGYEGPIIGVARTTTDFSTAYRSSFISGYDDNVKLDTTFYLYPTSGTPRAGTVYRFTYDARASVAGDIAHNDAIRFQPNPCGGTTMLVLPERLATKGSEVVLYDNLGREARRQEIVGEGSLIVTAGLPAGVYHAVVIARDGRYSAAPLVVR